MDRGMRSARLAKPGRPGLALVLALAATTTACDSSIGIWEILHILRALGIGALIYGVPVLVVFVVYRWYSKRRSADRSPPDEDLR